MVDQGKILRVPNKIILFQQNITLGKPESILRNKIKFTKPFQYNSFLHWINQSWLFYQVLFWIHQNRLSHAGPIMSNEINFLPIVQLLPWTIDASENTVVVEYQSLLARFSFYMSNYKGDYFPYHDWFVSTYVFIVGCFSTVVSLFLRLENGSG